MIRTWLSILINLSIFLVTSPCSMYGQSYLAPPVRSNFSSAICPSSQVKTKQGDLSISLNQQSKSASPQVEKIRHDVQKIGIAGKVTVFQIGGNKLYGTMTKINQDEFEIAEVDLRQIITIQYTDVKRIRSGIGRINLITGKRSNPSRGVRIAAIAVGLFMVLGLPIIILANAKD